MPRLFTGLEVPEDLARNLSELRGGLSGARWIEPGDFHLTLRFIGDVDRATAQEIDLQLSGLRSSSFTVVLDRLEIFGSGVPRAIVVRARLDRSLSELQRDHERLIRRAGAPAGTRKFVPHVTLARLRRASGAAVAEYIVTRGVFRIREFEARHFTMFSSKPSIGGGPYIREAIYPLEARDENAREVRTRS